MPRNPVFCDFPPLEVQSTRTQTVKKLRNFGEKLLGQTDFFPKSAPSSGNLRKFFRFRLGISLSAKGCPRPKGPRKPVFCDFPPLGVQPTRKMYKSCSISGRNFRGGRIFLKSKKKVTTLSGMVVCNFFTFYVLPDWTPTCGKSQNTGIASHFGLGRPWVRREIPGMGRKQKNTISRC